MKNSKKLIRLISHDGSANYLEETKNKNEFRLIVQFDSTRVSQEAGIITFVDPSGGPMITVGDRVPVFDPDMREKTVEKIIAAKKGFIIIVK